MKKEHYNEWNNQILVKYKKAEKINAKIRAIDFQFDPLVRFKTIFEKQMTFSANLELPWLSWVSFLLSFLLSLGG